MIADFVGRSLFKIAAAVFSALLSLSVLITAYAGYIPSDVWAIPSVAVLMFVPLALLLLATGVLWLCFKKWISGGICLLTLFLCGAARTANFPLNISEQKPDKNEKTLTLLTYNVYALTVDREAKVKTSPVLSYIIQSGADIVCLQEAGSAMSLFPGQLDSLMRIYPYKTNYGQSELTMLSKYPIRNFRNSNESKNDKDEFRLTGFAEVDYEGLNILIANVHLTSFCLSDSERKVLKNVAAAKEYSSGVLSKLKEGFEVRGKLARHLKSRLSETGMRNIIVCGDFNDVPGSYTYRTLSGDDFKDAYAESGFGPMVTYNAHHMYFHLDHILYRGDNIRALSCERGGLRNSDHFPVIAKFAVKPD